MGTIRVRGAREHTLRAIDLDLPDDGFVVVCGRSGSGKTSLALDTMYAEGRRRYLEALSLGRAVAGGPLPPPAVDRIDGLPPTVALEQIAAPPPRTATVGSLTSLDALLAALWGRAGTLHDPDTGEALEVTPHDAIVSALTALPEGTRLHVEAPLAGPPAAVLAEVVRAGFSRVRHDGEVLGIEALRPIDVRGPLRVVVDRIRVQPGREGRLHEAVRVAMRAGQGVVVAVTDDAERVFRGRAVAASGEALPALRPALLRRGGPGSCTVCGGRGGVDDRLCDACGGSGLGPVARAVRFAGRSLPDVLRLDLGRLRDLAATWPRDAVTGPLADSLQRACAVLCDLGLGGLTAARDATTLSASEWQRVRLAAVLGAELSGVLWILDEPTAGLDPAHTATAVAGLRALRDRGNGLLVVTHDPEVVRAADRVIEFGPGPGVDGGRVVFDGTPAALAHADTPTARALAGVEPLARRSVLGTPMTLRVREHPVLAAADIPLRRGALNALTGPAGAGRTLALGLVEHADLDGGDGLARVVAADGAAARASWRSMPATYIGLWDTLRELLAATTEAAVRGLDARAFSLAVPGGRCEACEGRGSRRVELGVLPPVDVPCAVCDGRRFAGDVLAVTWKGLDAAGLLGLTVDAARPLLSGHPRLDDGLRALADVGLGHITLGQAVPTLSGGEARRLRLARELVRAGRRGGADTLVVLDDPTVGLHPADVPVLARTLDRLVQEGATVVIATRDPALLAIADHVVTLAPVGRVAEVSPRT